MSSFLTLGVPPAGVGPGVLTTNVAVVVNATTATAVYTAPARCVVTGVVLRSGATAYGTTTSFKVGVTGALAAIVATTVATSLPTTCNFYVPATVTTAATALAAASVVYFSTVQVDGGTATASTVDILGYVY